MTLEFSARTLLGNWYEQRVAENDTLQHGTDMHMESTMSSFISSVAEANGAISNDGQLTHGDAVIIKSCSEKYPNSFLSVNNADPLNFVSKQYYVNASMNSKVDKRGVFVLEKVDNLDVELCYGDLFRLRLASDIFPEPMYLHSATKSFNLQTLVSQKQVLYLAPIDHQRSLFTFTHIDPSFREDYVGTPVQPNEGCLFYHHFTGQCVSIHNTPLQNIYGLDYEIVVETQKNYATKQPTDVCVWKMVDGL
ncbi:hypothetical protein PCE1_001653 [Barthelona sp. PCE]